MNTRKLFEKAIISQSDIPNKKGYVAFNKDNLIKGIDLSLFESDLRAGSGNELESKFNALYSSSALAVNNFSFLKKTKQFEILGCKNFHFIRFERKFKTGLGGSAPNLDVTLENETTMIAFESKYLELLQRKEAKFSASYCKEKLPYLSNFWFNIIEDYKSKKLYLDVAQLIKHSIGLINYHKLTDKKILLVYIYWQPKNFANFEVYNHHEKELNKFSERMSSQSDINFLTMTYSELWDHFTSNKNLVSFSKALRKRYDISIN